jgi:hypothetical protein
MPIPPPPPELFDWLLQVLQSFCPAPVPAEVLGRIKRFGLLDQLKVKRGLAAKYRDEGRSEEWKQTKDEVMRQVRELAREATLEDVEDVFA